MTGVLEAPGAQLEAAATRALDALGQTPAEVAGTLYRSGYKGLTCVAAWCPVAAYLSDRFGHGLVGPRLATVVMDGVRAELELPEAVRGFVEAFDNGAFTHLLGITR